MEQFLTALLENIECRLSVFSEFFHRQTFANNAARGGVEIRRLAEQFPRLKGEGVWPCEWVGLLKTHGPKGWTWSYHIPFILITPTSPILVLKNNLIYLITLLRCIKSSFEVWGVTVTRNTRLLYCTVKAFKKEGNAWSMCILMH